VVTDQRMPGTTGALVLHRAREVNPLARRVIVSASALPDHLLEAINCGEVERYLLKPLAQETLRDTIDGLAREYFLARRQHQRVLELQDQIAALKRRMNRPLAPDGWDRLETEVLRATRYQRPLALIVIEQSAAEIERFRALVREVDLLA